MRKIFIAGHGGLAGSGIHRALIKKKDVTVVTKARSELDLERQSEVEDFFRSKEIDEVYIAAAKVGGIHANATYPADFISANLCIQTNLIKSAFDAGIRKLLFLGSSCIYPKNCPQPMREESLLTGPLEVTNAPYAIAKISGIKLIEALNIQYSASHEIDYRSLMPTNLYGPKDNFHPTNSHVIPGLIRRFHDAKTANLASLEVWGTGAARREFLHSDDLGSACVHLMENVPVKQFRSLTNDTCHFLNVGSGKDISILDLASMIKEVVGFKGEITFDTEKPDGHLLKMMDSRKFSLTGWKPAVSFETGLEAAYAWFLKNKAKA